MCPSCDKSLATPLASSFYSWSLFMEKNKKKHNIMWHVCSRRLAHCAKGVSWHAASHFPLTLRTAAVVHFPRNPSLTYVIRTQPLSIASLSSPCVRLLPKSPHLSQNPNERERDARRLLPPRTDPGRRRWRVGSGSDPSGIWYGRLHPQRQEQEERLPAPGLGSDLVSQSRIQEVSLVSL